MKVLVIDDHPLILSALQNVIQGMGSDKIPSVVPNSPNAMPRLSSGTTFEMSES